MVEDNDDSFGGGFRNDPDLLITEDPDPDPEPETDDLLISLSYLSSVSLSCISPNVFACPSPLGVLISERPDDDDRTVERVSSSLRVCKSPSSRVARAIELEGIICREWDRRERGRLGGPEIEDGRRLRLGRNPGKPLFCKSANEVACPNPLGVRISP